MNTDEPVVGYSITELSECVKELVRIVKCLEICSPALDRRLDDVYKKATQAKDRIA